MNLKELVRAQSTLVQNRQDESDTLCKQAYFLIAEAESQGFADKSPLKQAMRLFIQAARQKRRYVEPYIGLAYLSLLIDQREVAQKYLRTALQIEPENEDALRLQRYLNEEPEAQPEQAFQLLELAPEVVSDMDPDQLYDQLEQGLLQMVRELMKQPPPEATIKADELEALHKQLDELETRAKQFDRQITQLDREFDTSELRRRLRPLEAMVQRAQRAVEVSERMQMIQKQIQGLIDTVQGISQRIQSPSPESLKRADQELEALMDSCDWVADQLDALDAQGHNIAPLEYSYNLVASLVEQVRDTIDEYGA